MATIKQEIIGLMIATPPNIQAQLGDAVGVIADSDFWRGWDTLVDVSRHRNGAHRRKLIRPGPCLATDCG